MLQFVRIQSIEQDIGLLCILVCGVVGGVWYNSVSKGRFSVNGRSKVSGGSLYGDV
jgi:hypothetical protein